MRVGPGMGQFWTSRVIVASLTVARNSRGSRMVSDLQDDWQEGFGAFAGSERFMGWVGPCTRPSGNDAINCA